jgi:murein DD-endopeptidase MepM/ murein hydrolase activator NlpD
MAGKYHTVILVPHTRAKLRKWRISTTQVGIFAGTLLFLTLAASLITWSYLRTTVDQKELSRLRTENDNLREVNQSFEDSIRDLNTDLSNYEERTRQLAIVAGLGNLTDDSGVGGDLSSPTLGASGSGNPSLDEYLNSFENRTAQLSGQLSKIQDQLDERLRWTASMPSITPARGIMTSRFGTRRDPVSGKPAFHPAIDISAPKGHPVVAPADGVVLRSGRNGGLGKSIVLSHGYGLTTRFGHLSRIDVQPGQKVRRGDVIGAVGSTGRSTGYHLHYEVLEDGKQVNPLAYMLDRPFRR